MDSVPPDPVFARQSILDRLRSKPLAHKELPETINGPWVRYPDRALQLEAVVESVGGHCRTWNSLAELRMAVASALAEAGGPTATWLNDGPSGTVDLRGPIDRDSLEPLALVVAEGEFAVAENGAVWVNATLPRLRAALFLAQRMVLVVPHASIVDTMHQAYARLSFGGSSFGIFISGPSKTADIEQSLVIGAQGVRSQQVWLYRNDSVQM
jgi:L-lactate dehydrogenase complex protein LldG